MAEKIRGPKTITPEGTFQAIRKRAPEEAPKGWNWNQIGGRHIVISKVLGAVDDYTFPHCPRDKRWYLVGGWFERDTSATLGIEILTGVLTIDDAGQKVTIDKAIQYTFVSAGTSAVTIGPLASATGLQMGYPLPLGPTMKVKISWGATQTSPEVRLWVLEVDLE